MSYKYVGCQWRIFLNYDTVGMWNKDYSNVSFYFLPEEIAGKKSDFVLAAGYTMKASINNVSKGKIESYNRDTCIKDKHVLIHFTNGTDWKEARELILKACDLIIERSFDREIDNPLVKLACKYENEIKEFAKTVKNDIVNETEDFRISVTHFPAD